MFSENIEYFALVRPILSKQPKQFSIVFVLNNFKETYIFRCIYDTFTVNNITVNVC